MKCVDTYKTNEKAQEMRNYLKSKGIEAKVTVDPVEGLYPEHSDYHQGGVAVIVADKDHLAATKLLLPTPLRKAS